MYLRLIVSRTKFGYALSVVLLLPKTVFGFWRLEILDHNFEGIVFIFGIHLWGFKDLPTIKIGFR
jgi:hypothetical protein